MEEKIVELKNVSMNFKLEQNKIHSLKEFVIRAIKNDLKYEEYQALSDISFSVNRGDVFGIIGRNGAGKSTLLKCISGIMIPTSGEIFVHGSIVPMLELGSGFDFELTGRENIFLNGAILGFSEEFIKGKYNEILEFSELGSFINEPLRNYSSGMMMRLAFSIATVVNPEILIVDEILSVGDSAFQEKSYNRMREMMRGGATVFFVSHSIDQVKDICNKAIWLENGRMKLCGDAQEVCDAYTRAVI